MLRNLPLKSKTFSIVSLLAAFGEALYAPVPRFNEEKLTKAPVISILLPSSS